MWGFFQGLIRSKQLRERWESLISFLNRYNTRSLPSPFRPPLPSKGLQESSPVEPCKAVERKTSTTKQRNRQATSTCSHTPPPAEDFTQTLNP